MGGRFALSDDSHGVEQVGLNYQGVLDTVRQAGIQELVFFEKKASGSHAQNGDTSRVSLSTRSVAEVEASPFWTSSSSTQL